MIFQPWVRSICGHHPHQRRPSAICHLALGEEIHQIIIFQKCSLSFLGMIKLNTCCYDCLGSTSLTTQPALGSAFQLGHMDFYPDGGKSSWGNIWISMRIAPILFEKQWPKRIITRRIMAAKMVEKQNKWQNLVGEWQPGCWDNVVTGHPGCSHGRSIQYYYW